MNTATGVYAFTSHHLAHNHRLDPESTRMSAMARRFAPSQVDMIASMHSCGSSVPQIIAKIKETTNAVVLNRDIYNALSRLKEQFMTV